MNPPKELPPQFSATEKSINQLRASLLPEITEDLSEEQAFSSPWTLDEIAWAKNHIKGHAANSSKGLDGVSYQRILSVEKISHAPS